MLILHHPDICDALGTQSPQVPESAHVLSIEDSHRIGKIERQHLNDTWSEFGVRVCLWIWDGYLIEEAA
ncbi:hypothetical protein AB4Y77_11925 [Paenarthrobacter sp. YAF11_1]|uniref:hypothetical protein n=1 Tax=Paenarthrobacter sp. YAF11_1 TaxID=3233074 RepID=UPI003F9CDAAD